MKKVLLLLGVVTLLTTGMFVTSCDEDNPVNCTQLAFDYTNAASAYFADDSDANCITLKNAIENYLDSSCPALTDALRTSLQVELEALPCYP